MPAGTLQHLADEVVQRAVAGRSIGDLAGLRLRDVDQLLDCLGREGGVGDEHVAGRRNGSDRLEVLDGVEPRASCRAPD
jgi:hypothetical protein